MSGDEFGPAGVIPGVQDPSDISERDVQLTQAVDDLGGWDLVRAVVAVASRVVDSGRNEEFSVMVAAQGSHAQVGEVGELSDRQSRCHWCSVDPLGGESTA